GARAEHRRHRIARFLGPRVRSFDEELLAIAADDPVIGLAVGVDASDLVPVAEAIAGSVTPADVEVVRREREVARRGDAKERDIVVRRLRLARLDVLERMLAVAAQRVMTAAQLD